MQLDQSTFENIRELLTVLLTVCLPMLAVVINLTFMFSSLARGKKNLTLAGALAFNCMCLLVLLWGSVKSTDWRSFMLVVFAVVILVNLYSHLKRPGKNSSP
jgi:integral membrane sensor domain MASE1